MPRASRSTEPATARPASSYTSTPGSSESGGTVSPSVDERCTSATAASARSASTPSMSRRAVNSRSSWMPSPTTSIATTISPTVEATILPRKDRGTSRGVITSV